MSGFEIAAKPISNSKGARLAIKKWRWARTHPYLGVEAVPTRARLARKMLLRGPRPQHSLLSSSSRTSAGSMPGVCGRGEEGGREDGMEMARCKGCRAVRVPSPSTLSLLSSGLREEGATARTAVASDSESSCDVVGFFSRECPVAVGYSPVPCASQQQQKPDLAGYSRYGLTGGQLGREK